MKTPYEGTLTQIKGKLTLRNEKRSRLSYKLVMRFPFPSFPKSRLRYGADYIVSVVFFWIDASYKILESKID